MTDLDNRCEWSDLHRDECAHCGARPGDRGVLKHPTDRPYRWDGQGITRRNGRNLFPTPDTPPDPGKPLELARKADAGYCLCGQPTRDGAYGCDDCAGELHRFFAEIPWLVDQLNSSITRQRAKNPNSSGGSGGKGLPWMDRASIAERRLEGLLALVVRLCDKLGVAHQSPHLGPPDPGPIGDSRWLLWRVDGLPQVEAFPDVLRAAMHTERHVLRVIDSAPDLLYLGTCDRVKDENGTLCGGAVYAVAGEATGRCRACRAKRVTETARDALYEQLDDMLCTATEIAELATYLGIPANRDRVRNLVYQWAKRGRLTNHGTRDKQPVYRYGEVSLLLAATYDNKGA